MATITIPSIVRQGTVHSQAVAWPGGSKTIAIQINLPVQAERDNPTSRIDFAAEVSKDGGGTWKAFAMAGWSGGAGNHSKDGSILNPAPFLSCTGPKLAADVRLAATMPNPLTVGATVTVT